jgi:hypothetical protein
MVICMPDDPGTLTIRVTVIAGQRHPDDFVAIWRGTSIGRIFLGSGAPYGTPPWSWSCHISGRPQQSDERGTAVDLDDANRQFKAAWSRMRGPHRRSPRRLCYRFDTAASDGNIRTWRPTGRMYPGGCAGLGAAVPGPCFLAGTPFRA